MYLKLCCFWFHDPPLPIQQPDQELPLPHEHVPDLSIEGERHGAKANRTRTPSSRRTNVKFLSGWRSPSSNMLLFWGGHGLTAWSIDDSDLFSDSSLCGTKLVLYHGKELRQQLHVSNLYSVAHRRVFATCRCRIIILMLSGHAVCLK